MSHDEFCPNKPCTCKPDDYGHQFDCEMRCLCNLIAKAVARTREQVAREIEESEQEFHSLDNEKFLRVNGTDTTVGELDAYEKGMKYAAEIARGGK